MFPGHCYCSPCTVQVEWASFTIQASTGQRQAGEEVEREEKGWGREGKGEDVPLRKGRKGVGEFLPSLGC